MSTVLVTGFGPYGTAPTNPAQLTAEALDGRVIAGATVVTPIVPNTYFDSIACAVRAIEEVGPELLVMLGEYGGRAMITVERLAQNVNDCARYGLADTAGKVLNGEPTVPDGPVAYYSTLPIRAMVLAMRRAGIPADISDAAGTFVCNHLMYGMLHHIAKTICRSEQAGFTCRTCPKSPAWTTTSAPRACRWTPRSPPLPRASKRPCTIASMPPSPSRPGF